MLSTTNIEIEQAYQITLNSIEGMGPAQILRFLEAFPHADSARKLKKKDLDELKLKEYTQHHLLQQLDWSLGYRELELAHQNQICILTHREIQKIPLLQNSRFYFPVLYLQGNKKLCFKHSLSVVGTRSPTHYGLEACKRILEDLVPLKALIVSGMARGIDRQAHHTAMEKGLITIGIPGCGLLASMNRETKRIQRKLVEDKGGSLLSPFPLQKNARTWHFPFRNRLIAALGQGTVVVESKNKGGALITARMALDDNREVLTVPGSIFSEYSEGCHDLLEAGAHLVRNGQDIAQALGWDFCPAQSEATQEPPALGPENKVLQCLGFEPLHLNEVVNFCSFPQSQVLAILSILEVRGQIRSFPGMLYALNNAAKKRI